VFSTASTATFKGGDSEYSQKKIAAFAVFAVFSASSARHSLKSTGQTVSLIHIFTDSRLTIN
jgi:hypothetical protein